MRNLHTNRRMERIAMILILCVAPCLFVIPVLCGPLETSLSSAEEHCPIMIFVSASDTLILAEDITYLSKPKSSTLLSKYKETLNLPIVFSLEEKPPKTLA